MRSQIVSFHCVLRNRVGKLISSTFNQDVITQVEGQPELLRGLADGMKNLRKGEKRRIALTAEQAYGFYDPQLVVQCSRQELSRGKFLVIGDTVTARSGAGAPRIFRVVQTSDGSVTLDANHPLAGQDLVFDIATTDVRDATPEEIADSSFDETTSSALH